MARVSANGIELEYEVNGHGPPLVLIMGLSGQLTDWPESYVDRLATHFQVIRFDNRDIGLSTHIDAEVPTRLDFAKALVAPRFARSAYVLADMAADTAALLDALSIDKAHVLGMSMGGMIAQQLALDHPSRVQSLCSVMSTTGNRRVGRPTVRVALELARRGDTARSDALDAAIDFFRLIGGRDFDEQAQRARTKTSLERSFSPAGIMRQAFAIAASPDRTKRLRSIRVPTLVVHGLDDTLVRPSGGIATAEAVPDSRLVLYPRMGHDLPATRLDEMVQAIVANTKR